MLVKQQQQQQPNIFNSLVVIILKHDVPKHDVPYHTHLPHSFLDGIRPLQGRRRQDGHPVVTKSAHLLHLVPALSVDLDGERG